MEIIILELFLDRKEKSNTNPIDPPNNFLDN